MPKILVADDSIAVRKVAERLLVSAGLEVALAASGEEALAWLAANERPDLIVSDVIMTDKSGYDVCAFVRSHPTLSETPVLLVSGIVNEEVTGRAESCRADGVLKKPFQGTSLQDRVLELLAKRQAQPTGPAAAAAGATSPSTAQPMSTGPKVYRITEEQLQAFRQATNRIKELEALLETSARTASRIDELEALLAEEQARSAQLAQQVETLSQADSRLVELEARLAQEQAQSAEATGQFPVQGCADDRGAEFEALLAQERERSAFLLQRVQEAERAAAQAEERLEAATRALAEIARLAAQPAKAETSIPPE